MAKLLLLDDDKKIQQLLISILELLGHKVRGLVDGPDVLALLSDDVGVRVGGDFTLDELERAHVTLVLARAPTLEAAARILGIDDSTLWRKRKRYGLLTQATFHNPPQRITGSAR
jgi:DNA-binding NtrC family response regulator